MYKTLVFNELYNWLIINELHFGVKNLVFRVFLTILRFILFYILIVVRKYGGSVKVNDTQII